MEFTDIPEEDLEHLQEIRSLFEQLENEMARISDRTRTKMLDYHTEKHTLNHCIEQGKESADELFEASIETNLVGKLVIALEQVLNGDGEDGLDDINCLRENTDPAFYKAAVKQLWRGSR